MTEKANRNLKNEIAILQNADKNHSIYLIEAMDIGDSHYIITDYVFGMDLITMQNEVRHKFTEPELQVMFKKIFDSVYDLHKKHIVHRDFHSGNVMINFPFLKPTKQQL